MNALSQAPGSVNRAFDARFSYGSKVVDMIQQSDGRVILAGSFTLQNDTEPLTLARLNLDGSIDPTFDVNRFMQTEFLALAPDDKFYLSGFPLGLNPIVRLTRDGIVDLSFEARGMTNVSGAENSEGSAMAADGQGRVLLGGYWISGDGVRGLVRLLPDGAIDPEFSKGSGFGFYSSAGPAIRGIQVQPDGKILVTGEFSSFNGVPRTEILRLNDDGSIDETFDPGNELATRAGSSPNGFPSPPALTSTGKIYVALNWYVAQLGHCSVFRLEPDGKIDPSFLVTTSTNSLISDIAVDAADHALVVPEGPDSEFGGYIRSGVIRLNANGGVDPAFVPPESLVATSLLVRRDGGVLVAGSISEPDGTERNGILLLHGSNPQMKSPVILQAPESVTSEAGTALNLTVVVSTDTVPAPTFQWYHNDQPLAGATNAQLFLPALTPEEAGSYKVTVSNSGGTVTSDPGVVTVIPPRVFPGAIDPEFKPEEVANATTVNVMSIAPTDDGGVYAARFVKFLSGSSTNELIRFRSSGELDPTFHEGVNGPHLNQPLWPVLVRQPDGNLLVLGQFDSLNGISRPYLARLDKTGQLDTSFAPQFNTGALLLDCAVQPDGRMVVVGNFSSVNGLARANAARLMPDGSVDPSFDASSVHGLFPQQGFSGIHLLPNSQMLISGTGVGELFRVNADGTRDSSYSGAFGETRFAVGQSGSILLALGTGYVATGGHTNYDVAQLTPTGRLDPNFNLTPDGSVNDVTRSADGKFYMGGSFHALSGTTRNGLARLNPDGTLDSSFDPGLGLVNSPESVIRIVLSTDNGRLWIAGDFDDFNGFRRQGIALVLTEGGVRLMPPKMEGQLKDVSCPTEPGFIYHLEASDRLADATWRELGFLVGDGELKEFQDTEPSGSERFYRVRITPIE